MKHRPASPVIFLPMPGERFHTHERVVASTWLDDEAPEPTALLLVISLRPPYYQVLNVARTPMGWVITHATEHVNIVPATAEYASRGGY